MKTTARQFANALFVSLFLAAIVVNAQATSAEPGDLVTKERSFDAGMYLGADRKLNLRLIIHRKERIIITIKDASNTVLYREHLRWGPASYWRKFDFEESESGLYQLEIKDGRQTIVRQVEVVDMPAIESQRYITYGPQTSR